MSIRTYARSLYRNSGRLEAATANGNRHWNPACRPSDDLSSYPPADSFEADATAYATAYAADQSRVFTGDETFQQATAEQDRVNSIIEQGFPATRRHLTRRKLKEMARNMRDLAPVATQRRR